MFADQFVVVVVGLHRLAEHVAAGVVDVLDVPVLVEAEERVVDAFQDPLVALSGRLDLFEVLAAFEFLLEPRRHGVEDRSFHLGERLRSRLSIGETDRAIEAAVDSDLRAHVTAEAELLVGRIVRQTLVGRIRVDERRVGIRMQGSTAVGLPEVGLVAGLDQRVVADGLDDLEVVGGGIHLREEPDVHTEILRSETEEIPNLRLQIY